MPVRVGADNISEPLDPHLATPADFKTTQRLTPRFRCRIQECSYFHSPLFEDNSDQDVSSAIRIHSLSSEDARPNRMGRKCAAKLVRLDANE